MISSQREAGSFSPGITALIVHSAFAFFKVLYVWLWAPGLYFEEAQYWIWSKYLDWSYYSKPPLIAWVNYVSTSVLGDTEIALRLNAIICGWLIAFFVFRITHEITRDERKAMWASISLIAFPYFWIISLFFTTDSLVTVCWIAGIYYLYRLERGIPGAWWQLGIVIGLGMLSKYVMALMVPFMLTYLFLYHRLVLRKWQPYLTIILSGIFCFPIIYWNYLNDWVTFQHVFFLASDSGSVTFSIMDSLKYTGEYLAGQFFSWMWVFLLPTLRGFRELVQLKISKEGFLTLAPVVIVFFLFLAVSIQSTAEMNWTFFAIPSISAFGVLNLQMLSVKWLRLKVITISCLLVMVLFIPTVEKVYDYPVSMNPFRRFSGWEQLANDLGKYLDTLDSDYYVIADTYGTASLMAFYLDNPPEVFAYNPNDRMNQFCLWGEWYQPDVRERPAVFIGHISRVPASAGTVLDTTKVWLHINEHNIKEFNIVLYDQFEAEMNQHSGY